MRKLYDAIDVFILKHGKAKTFWILFALYMILSTISINIDDFFQKRFDINGHSFHYVSRVGETWLFEDDNKKPLELKVEGRITDALIVEEMSVLYDGHLYERKASYASMQYSYFRDGEVIATSDFIDVIVQSGNVVLEESPQFYEKTLFQKLHALAGYIASGQNFYYRLLSGFLGILGLLSIVYATFFWELKYGLYVDNGEPSRFYISTSYFMGLLIMLMGLLFPCIAGGIGF